MMDDREEEEASREVTSSKVRKTSDEVAATEENLFNNEAAATSFPDQNQSNILSLLKEIKDNQLKFYSTEFTLEHKIKVQSAIGRFAMSADGQHYALALGDGAVIVRSR